MNRSRFTAILVAAALALPPAFAAAQEPARPALGVMIQVQDQGPVVVEIQPGQTAEAIGFEVGDVVLEAGGRPISEEVLRDYWGQVQPGDPVSFKVRRAGEVVDLAGPATALPEGAAPPPAAPQPEVDG